MNGNGRRGRQDLGLGLGMPALSANPTLQGELQVASLLQDPIFTSTAEGLVTDFRVGGQPLLCSDRGVGLRCWDMAAQAEGHRAIGIPCRAKTLVSVEFALAAAGYVVGGVAVDDIPEDEAVDPNHASIADRLNYVFGLGLMTIGAGATTTFTATSRRGCRLGRMILYGTAAGAYTRVGVKSIDLNNSPLASGRVSGSTIDYLPLGFFDYTRTDIDGICLGADIGFNETLTLTLTNMDGVPYDIYGGIFIEPV